MGGIPIFVARTGQNGTPFAILGPNYGCQTLSDQTLTSSVQLHIMDSQANLTTLYLRYLESGQGADLQNFSVSWTKALSMAFTDEDILYDVMQARLAIERAQSAAIALDDPGVAELISKLPMAGLNGALLSGTPMERLYNLISSLRDVGWANDQRSAKKAYVLACFSEVAYLHLAAQDVTGPDRFKVFLPSQMLELFLKGRTKVDLKTILAQQPIEGQPIAAEILETGGGYVYLVVTVPPLFAAVAVRGTVTVWGDWLGINANFRKNVGYHAGFHDEALEAWGPIEKKLEQLYKDWKILPLYFTGHSLGAAVAGILGNLWREMAKTPYLFASPRFATGDLAKQRPPYAYVTPDDFVPHLPPRWSGFDDAGTPPQVVPKNVPRRNAMETLRQWITPGAGFAAPHNIGRYRSAIGLDISEDLPETVYMDKLVAEVAREAAKRK